MASYWNLRNHEWVLWNNDKKGDGKSYRIAVGLNRGLPEGLDTKFRGMLQKYEEKEVVPKVPPSVTKPKPEFTIESSATAEEPKPKDVEKESHVPETKKDALEALEEQYKKDIDEIENSDANRYAKSQRKRHKKTEFEKNKKILLGE